MNSESLENIVYYHEVINRLYKHMVIENKNKTPEGQPNGPRPKVSERDFDIFCEHVLHGVSYDYLAREYDISRTRVSQIVKKTILLCKRFR